MNYEVIYNSLMETRKELECDRLVGYFEKHHIIPKSMGGSNEEVNLVKLTAREHYVAHRLLNKIYPDNIGMKKALLFMASSQEYRGVDYHTTSREYEFIRKSVSLARKYDAGYDETQMPLYMSIKTVQPVVNRLSKLKYRHCGVIKPLNGKERTDMFRIVVNVLASQGFGLELSYSRNNAFSSKFSHMMCNGSRLLQQRVSVNSTVKVIGVLIDSGMLNDMRGNNLALSRRTVSRITPTDKLLDLFGGKIDSVIDMCMTRYEEAGEYTCSNTGVQQKDFWM